MRVVSLRLSDELLDKVLKDARKSGLSFSEVVRQALEGWVEAKSLYVKRETFMGKSDLVY